MQGGGEEHLVKGIAFMSIGLSTPVSDAAAGPALGQLCKLSVKLKAFHILHTTIGTVHCITYNSESSGLVF